MTQPAHVEDDGTVLYKGKTVGLVERHTRKTCVYLRANGGAILIAEFGNYRPYDSAVQWIEFMLSERTPHEITKLHAEGVNLIELSKKLGYKSLALRDAETVKPAKNPKTGQAPRHKR